MIYLIELVAPFFQIVRRLQAYASLRSFARLKAALLSVPLRPNTDLYKRRFHINTKQNQTRNEYVDPQ